MKHATMSVSTRRMLLPLLLAGLALLLLGAGDESLSRLPGLDETQYFGVYVKKQKVGWRSTRMSSVEPGRIVIENEAEFVQRLGGREITMKSRDRRTFDRASGRLVQVLYQMEGPTGQTQITGVVSDTTISLTTRSGGQLTTESLPAPRETLRDALAVELAIIEGRARDGLELTVPQFDPTMKKSLTTRINILAPKERLLAGVMKTVYPVTGQVLEIGAPLSATYDTDGRLLQTSLSLLEAVWESEAQARSRAGLGNILEPLAVRPPRKMRLSHPVARMQAAFRGIPEASRMTTDSQSWVIEEGLARVTVTRPALEPGATPTLAALDRSAHSEWLQRESRIQTDDPAIVTRAAQLAQGAATSGEVAKRILDWIYTSMKKAYTPTFSNASEAIASMEGDCGEHSVLYVALARAAGIPAREVVGLVYSNELGGFGYHAWAEVWLGRWIPVDPSWGQFPADASRVAFAFGGVERQVELISLMDALSLVALEAK